MVKHLIAKYDTKEKLLRIVGNISLLEILIIVGGGSLSSFTPPESGDPARMSINADSEDEAKKRLKILQERFDDYKGKELDRSLSSNPASPPEYASEFKLNYLGLVSVPGDQDGSGREKFVIKRLYRELSEHLKTAELS